MLGGPGLVGHVVEVEVFDQGPAGDLVGHVGRDDAQFALGPGQGGQDVEPRRQSPLVAEERFDLGRLPEVPVKR